MPVILIPENKEIWLDSQVADPEQLRTLFPPHLNGWKCITLAILLTLPGMILLNVFSPSVCKQSHLRVSSLNVM